MRFATCYEVSSSRTDFGGGVRPRRRARVLSAVLLVVLFCPPAAAQMTNLPAEVPTAIAQMGPHLDESISSQTYALMQPLGVTTRKCVLRMLGKYRC
jgi:hypothetical protein